MTTCLNMLCTIALLKYIQIPSDIYKIWHLFKRSLKLLNLATFRFENTGKTEIKEKMI